MDADEEIRPARTAGLTSYRGDNLVFIISQPKAGSTLLQRLLAGSPDIQTSAETWLMLHPVYGLRTRGIHADFNANWAATGVREFLDNYADGEETYRAGIRNFAATIYGRALQKSGKRLFLDKTPRYTMIVDDLYALFPAARFIILLRNPLAVLNSEIRTYVNGDWQILSRFRPDLIDAPRRLVDARRLLGKSAFEIRYEDLVTNPEESLRGICNFIGVNFDPDMLDYSDTPAPLGRMNDPVGIHRHTQPSTTSLDTWKKMADDPQLKCFALGYLDALGQQTVSDLGYDPVSMREEIEQSRGTGGPRKIYPWALAITPVDRRSARQEMQHAYIMAAQQSGVTAGLLAAAKVVAAKLAAGTKRLSGRKGASRNAEPAVADASNESGSALK